MSRHLARIVAMAVSISIFGSGGPIGHYAVTYERDVKPILERSCTPCHRLGGLAPMSLTTYQEALPWATAIAASAARGEMPPQMNRHPGMGGFRDSLTQEEVDTIVRWVLGGAPEKYRQDVGKHGREGSGK
jgi:hypothetical protein